VLRNKRFKSIVEKKGDAIKRRKSKKLSSNDVCVSKGLDQVWVYLNFFILVFG